MENEKRVLELKNEIKLQRELIKSDIKSLRIIFEDDEEMSYASVVQLKQQAEFIVETASNIEKLVAELKGLEK